VDSISCHARWLASVFLTLRLVIYAMASCAQIKEFVANLARNGGNLVLTNNNLWGKNAFRNQAAVLNTAARLDEVAALPETDIVRDAVIQRFEFTNYKSSF
jgi:hypothetical protein